jgi:hypothetical protein
MRALASHPAPLGAAIFRTLTRILGTSFLEIPHFDLQLRLPKAARPAADCSKDYCPRTVSREFPGCCL